MCIELSQFEAKAYKRLYELYKSTLLTIINRARTTSDMSNDPDRIKEILQVIGDEHKWDSYGIESKQITAIIGELEKCLNQ